MHLTHVANVKSSTKGPGSVSMYKMVTSNLPAVCGPVLWQAFRKLYNAKTKLHSHAVATCTVVTGITGKLAFYDGVKRPVSTPFVHSSRSV